jgi:hypothetical protein
MKKRSTLQTSFNLTDPFESALLEHALAQGSVSKYIKRLIHADKEGLRISAPVPAEANDKIKSAMNSVSL